MPVKVAHSSLSTMLRAAARERHAHRHKKTQGRNVAYGQHTVITLGLAGSVQRKTSDLLRTLGCRDGQAVTARLHVTPQLCVSLGGSCLQAPP
jgi:hypothetical protein